MFGSNWSVEQIESELALKFGLLKDSDQSDQQLINGGRLLSHGRLDRVLSRISDALDNQTLFQGEIRSLRDEVAELRKEYGSLQKKYGRRVDTLERGMKALQDSNRRLERLVAGKAAGGGRIDFPSESYLARPLVIRSNGEFLGVQGEGKKHFSLRDFVKLIEGSASASRSVDTRWQKKGGSWVLVVKTADSVSGAGQDVVLVTRKTVTPSGNTVTEIARLNIDGNDAPDSLLLSLFRQVRNVFGG